MPASTAPALHSINAPTSWAGRRLAELGWLPPIALATGIGLLLCSLADALSRATIATSPLVYWLGILLIALPIFYRLTSEEASPRERLVLVCLLGLVLYSVKVMRDAPLFTFSDELVHSFNVHQIEAHRHLFHENPILEATPFYPGLEGATSALTSLTGLSSFTAAAFLIGAARLVLVASLFFLFERVSGSARTAGLGVAIFAGNFNFLFWGAQFSYESLALPLLLLVLMALAEREAAPRAALRAWAVPIALAIPAVIITHHLTSYALVTVLVGLSLALWYLKRSWQPPNPWPFAVFAFLLALAWLVVVASSTIGYLSPVLTDAVQAIGHTISGEEAPRTLFKGGGSTVEATPLPARALALLAVLLLAAALPFGLREIWRRYRRQPFALIFAVTAVGFFLTLALRLAPAAWETGNRASEFFFIGLAFVVACAAHEGLRRWRGAKLTRPLLTAGIAVVLVGGAIAGWPWDSQLAQPLRVTAAGGTIVSPPLGMAEWAREEIPAGRFAATISDAGLLLTPGGKEALTGPSPDVEDLLSVERLEGWELPLLRRNRLRYVVADRRATSEDSLRGYYFAKQGTAAAKLEPKQSVAKFNFVPGAARIYTNGTITVFDLGEGR